jgi:hypothetical protein
MLNVVPKAIAHTIVLNDAVGASEFDLEMVMGQLEFDYLNEVSRRLAQAVEIRGTHVPAAS